MGDREGIVLDPGSPRLPSAAEPPIEGTASWILIAGLISHAQMQGVAIADLVKGTGLDEATLTDPTAEISWPSFVLVMRNCSTVWSEEELVHLGHGLLQLGLFRPIADLVRSLGSPVECYRTLFGPGCHPSFPFIELRFEQIDRENLRSEMRFSEGYESSLEFFLVRKGLLEAIPTLLGYPRAEVDLFTIPSGAIFEIRVLPIPGRLAIVRDWLHRLGGIASSRDRMTELMEMQARRHRVARNRIELLDAKLEALQRSEERFTHCFQAAPVAMLISRTHDLGVIDVNEKFLSSTGYSREEVMGWTRGAADIWMNSDDRESFHAATAEPSGSVDELEIRMRHRDGSEIIGLVSMEPVDLAGEPCFVLQAIDITRRKHNDRELAKYRGHLEELVEDRTRELERSLESLQQAERLASIGTLAAGVAHQINNPIASIRAASEFALLCGDQPDDAERYREALETCVEQADRCGRIVRNILRFSRGESGTCSPEDLRELVIGSCGLVTDYARESGATIEIDEGDEEIPVFVNSIEIEQVLVNVLRNAVESGAEKSRIEVRARRLETGAFVEIRDDGPGIEKQHLPFLFDPFYTTRLDRGGTGLGLSVAHGIVTAHGGTIRADTEADHGTAIQIQLPLYDGASGEQN